jgi:hypothetical protein
VSDILESLGDTSKLVIQGISQEIEKLVTSAIGTGVEEGLHKFSEKLLSITIAAALVATGFLLTLWGIATAIDTYFAMKGVGYVLIGLLASVTGALVYKK